MIGSGRGRSTARVGVLTRSVCRRCRPQTRENWKGSHVLH